MLVLEKQLGDMITMSTAGFETRIRVVAADHGKLKLAIDAPVETVVTNPDPKMDVDDILEQELRANLRQELLMF